MKNLKKFLALALVGIMVFSFTACSSGDNDDKDKDNKNEQTEEQKDDKDNTDEKDDQKEDDKDNNDAVSAEELLENIPVDDIESLSVYMEIAADLGMDLKQAMLDQGLTEDDIQAAIDEGTFTEEELTTSIVVDMELTLDMSKDYSHMAGSMEMSAMGEEESMVVDSYVDTSSDDEKITYTYDEYLESWYYEVEDKEDSESDSEAVEFISTIKDYVKSAEIAEEDDDKYTLDVVLDIASMYEEESDMVDDLVGSATDSIGDTEDVVGSIDELSVSVEIDKEEGYLLAVRIDLVDVVEDLLDSLSEGDEEVAAYSDYISVNELAVNIELSDYNAVEVEIPEDVIEEATEASYDDMWEDDDDTDDVDDEDSEVVYGGTYDIYNYDEELVATITIPDEYYADMDYSDENWLYLENDDWDSIDVSISVSYWVEDLMDGEEYEPDLEFYTRDEVEERESFETNQGTVRVFVHTWSMDENYEEDYYETIVYVLEKDGEIVLSVETYIDEIVDKGYTTETFIQTMLQ